MAPHSKLNKIQTNTPSVHSGFSTAWPPTNFSNLSLLPALHAAFTSARWTGYHSLDPPMLSFLLHPLALCSPWYMPCTFSKCQNPTHSILISSSWHLSLYYFVPLWKALILVCLSTRITSRFSLHEVVSSLKAGTEHPLTHLCCST